MIQHFPPSARRLFEVAAFSLSMWALAAASNAVMDTLSFRYDSSVFESFGHRDWFDPNISWRNKWKDGDRAKGEAFPLSSTALVATTDAWHLAKLFCISFIILSFLAPFTLLIRLPWWTWVAIFILLKMLWGLIFEGLFAWLFIVR